MIGTYRDEEGRAGPRRRTLRSPAMGSPHRDMVSDPHHTLEDAGLSASGRSLPRQRGRTRAAGTDAPDRLVAGRIPPGIRDTTARIEPTPLPRLGVARTQHRTHFGWSKGLRGSLGLVHPRVVPHAGAGLG